MYPARPVRIAVAAATAASLLLSLPIRAQERLAAAEPATFMAQLDVDGAREPLPATQGTAGPLFLLQPIVARLGARLDVIPLEQSHRLRIGETDVVLGPSTLAMTVGRSIVNLRQAPVISGAGLWVPFEALEQSFGQLLGLDLRWFPDERVLELKSRHAREVTLDVQVVHIQGVTTVVLLFDHAAKYQVATRGPVVDVEIPLDRVRLLKDPKPPRQSLLDRVEAGEHRVRLFLAAGAAAAEPYILPAGAGQGASGLRLVIDISSSASPPLAVDGGAALPDVDPNYEAPGLRTIVLDPGHGGAEHGAIGPAGTEEKELTLILAKALKRKLEERLAVQVVLTRNEDADLPLDTRTALANQTKGDLFISIHLNAAPESSAHGAETYFLAPKATDARALQVAESENRGGAGRERRRRGRRRRPAAAALGPGAEPAPGGEPEPGAAHPAGAQQHARLDRSRGASGAVRGAGGRHHAGGPGRAGLHHQPQGRRAPLGSRLSRRPARRRGARRRPLQVDRGRRHRERGRGPAPPAPTGDGRPMTSRAAWLLLVAAALLGVAALVVALSRDRSRGPAKSAALEGGAAADAGVDSQPVTVALYFPGPGGRLRREQRSIEGSADPSRVAARVVQALLEGPSSEQSFRAFPEDVTLGEVNVTGDGVTYVDLISTGNPTPPFEGSTVELLTLYSLVNSVVENVPGARSVVVLWNGRQPRTFGGHIDTSRPLLPAPDLATS